MWKKIKIIDLVTDLRWHQNVVRAKTMAHKVIAKCLTDVLTTFWCLLWWTDPRQHETWGDARGKNWKYRFTQRDLSAVSNAVIPCHINCWLVVISLPRRCVEYVVLSNLFATYKNIFSWGLMRLKIGLRWRQTWKVSCS